MVLQPFCWALVSSLSFLILFTQTVGLLGRVISPSQGLYLHTGQHKHRISAHNTDIHALSGIPTHDPSDRASEVGSCLRPRGHRGRQLLIQYSFTVPTFILHGADMTGDHELERLLK
jgi:hypothetical protein